MNLDELIYWSALIPIVLSTIIAAYNLISSTRLRKYKIGNKNLPFVSVLIPARNEAENITKCIQSIVNQSYKNLEIMVLDDNSSDNTAEIVKKIDSENVLLVNGQPLPDKWLGKNWACHQLSQKANGDILLFMDADVLVEPEAIESAVNTLNNTDSDMLSVFPTQIISSIGEYFIVPLMNWLLLNFLPLKLVRSSNNKSFTAANGQFILIRRNVYEKIGGHNCVKNKVVEDMEIAKALKRNNFRVMTLLGDKLIYCRMYKDFNSSVKGFAKNFYKGFNMPASGFIILLIIIEFIYLLPLLLVLASKKFIIHTAFIMISRSMIAVASRQNIYLAMLLHPFQMIMIFYVGIKSVYQSLHKGLEWKGRIID